jgi:hypothetical protein
MKEGEAPVLERIVSGRDEKRKKIKKRELETGDGGCP